MTYTTSSVRPAEPTQSRRPSALFRYIEDLQGEAPRGSVLDAGDVADRALAAALAVQGENLRARALNQIARGGRLKSGYDDVLAAERLPGAAE
ncbi:hypothetical protein [Novosphingobium sp. M1R2S20]|uniref:Uncharacterized protein n=1 Tax=Novosphingobium rhizovicinum TaxID=3228928 RepID=A0ABV3REQ7_9SPHN